MSAGGFGGVPPGNRTRIIDLTANVESDTQDYAEDNAPFSGFVVDPFLAFPGNTKETFGARLRDEQRSDTVLPRTERGDRFMYLDGVKEFFPTTFPVREGDPIRMEYKNLHNTTARYMPTYVPVVADDLLQFTAEDAFEARKRRKEQGGE